jgi:hypothetical protein
MLIINLKVNFIRSIKPGVMTLLSAVSSYPELETLFSSHKFKSYAISLILLLLWLSFKPLAFIKPHKTPYSCLVMKWLSRREGI